MNRTIMATILIGLDDTDNADSRGTGRLGRTLLAELVRRGVAPGGGQPCSLSVTRHQLLVDPRIPYTSHNSAACVAVASDDGTEAAGFVFDFVAERAAAGSDPGVCLAGVEAVAPAVRQFGRRAAVEVVQMSEAMALAADLGLELRGLGGSGLGVIGALAAVGLRAGGNDGRFIDLVGLQGAAGLRELADRVGAADLAGLGIRVEHRSRREPRGDDEYDTLGWVRPRLLGGRAVLPVAWNEERNAWVPIDRKRTQRRRPAE